MGGELGHDSLGTIVGGFSHILVAVAEAEEEVGQDMDNVRFEESAKHGAKLREGEEASLSVPVVLLVLQCFGQLGHDVQLLEREDSEALDKTSKTIGSSLPLTKVLSVEQGVQKFSNLKEELNSYKNILSFVSHPHQFRCLVLDTWSERGQAVRNSFLNLLYS